MLKKLFKETLIYGLSGYISKFISIFLLPLYTAKLTPGDYGVLALLGTIQTVSVYLVISGSDAAFGYYYFRREFASEKSKMVVSTLSIRLIFSVILLSVLFFMAPFLSEFIFHEDYSLFIRITALAIMFTSSFSFLQELLRFEFRPWLYTFFSTASVVISILLNMYFILYLKQGVYGALMASLLTNLALFVSTLIYVFRRYGFHFSGKWFKDILKYGSPLITASFAVWILQSTDLYFINHYTTISDVGIYQVGMKLAALLGMVSGTLQFAWGPFAGDIQYEPNARQIYAKVFEIFSIINILAVFMISMFSIDILKVFTQPAYYSAKAVVPFLCMSMTLWFGYFLAANGIALAKKLIHTIWITLSAAALNIILNFIFTPWLGAVGAALSLMIAYFYNFVVMLIISQKYYPIPYRYSRVLMVLLPTAVIIAAAYYYNFLLPVRIIISVLFLAYIAFFIYRFYGKSEEFRKIIDRVKRLKVKKEEVEEKISNEPFN